MAAPTEVTRTSVSGENLCEIELSVVTGFEIEAKDEVFEKIHVKCSQQRGKVTGSMPVRDVRKVISGCA